MTKREFFLVSEAYDSEILGVQFLDKTYPVFICCTNDLSSFLLQPVLQFEIELFLQIRFLFAGGYSPTATLVLDPIDFDCDDCYARSSTNKYGSSPLFVKFHSQQFSHFNPHDPFPIDFSPFSHLFFTDCINYHNTFYNPPYIHGISPHTGMATMDFINHILKFTYPSVWLVKQGSDWEILVKGSFVVTVRVNEPFTFYDRFGKPYSQPARFKSMELPISEVFLRRNVF